MMKKLVALLMALALLCTSIGAFAEEEIVVVPEEAEVVETETAETEEKKHECPGDIEFDGHYACKDDCVDTIAATCTEPGYKVYKCQAPGCGQTFQVKDKTQLALTHDLDYTKAVITVQPTCTSEGERVVPCNRKGCEGLIEKIQMEEHKWVKGEAVEVTCTTDGYTPYECSVCHLTEKREVVVHEGHKLVPNDTWDSKTELPAYDLEAEDVVIPEIYIHTDKKDPNCKDAGLLRKYAYCANCPLVIITEEKTNDLVVVDHQKDLEKFVERKTVDGKEEDYKVYTDRLRALVAEADEKTDTLTGTDKNGVDNIIVCGGHAIEGITDVVNKHHDVKITIVEPDCVNDGSLTLACTKCTAKVVVPLKALGHNYTTEKSDAKSMPTCEKDGLLLVTCTRCDFSEQVEITAPGAHTKDTSATATVTYSQVKYGDLESVKNAPNKDKIVACQPYTIHTSCTGFKKTVTLKNGTTYDVVVKCSKTYDEEKPATSKEHAKGAESIEVKADCQQGGFLYFYCKDCGYRESKVYEKLDHDKKIEKVIVAADCEEKGTIEYYCSMCEELQETKTIPALGHNKVVSEKLSTPATCTKDGEEVSVCTYCNKEFRKPIPAHHTAPKDEDIIKASKTDTRWAFNAATCTTEGSKTYMCEACHTFQTEKINPLGHTYERKGYKTAVKNKADGKYYDKYEVATCTSDAYYERHCTDCGMDKKGEKWLTQEIVYVEGTKLDHPIGTIILDTDNLPTCKSVGYAAINCAVCGNKYVDEKFVLPALPHYEQVSWNSKTGTYEIKCVKPTWKEWTTLTKDYLKEELAGRYLDEEKAEAARKDILGKLYTKLLEKDSNNIPGIGCGATETVDVAKTHYDIAMKDGIITLTPAANCVRLDNPVVVVNWSFTLSDGNSFGVTVPFIAYDLKTLSYDVSSVKTPYGAKLNCVTVFVSDVVTSDITKVGPKGYGVAQF